MKILKRGLFILIILITLIELYLGIRIFIAYKGVYDTGIFIPFILQPVLYICLLKNNINFGSWKEIALVIMYILLPIIIYFTLPQYTYIEGQMITMYYLDTEKEVEFVDYSISKDTIPVINNPKGFLINNRAYYYHIKLSDKDRYFIVNPIVGKVRELSESYWRH